MLLAQRHGVALICGLAMLTIAVAAGTSSGATTPTIRAQAGDPFAQKCWSTYVVPGTQQHALYDLEAIGANELWAVGMQTEGGENKTLTARWDATGWKIVPSPDITPGYNRLVTVSAISPDDVWAAGETFRSVSITSRPGSLVMHWNGTQWEVVPNPGHGTVSQVDAVSSNDVWAVGTYGVAKGDNRAFVMHWDGKSWRDSTPGDPNAYARLNAVAAISPNDVWVLGTRAWHWDGSKWNITQIPGRAELLAVSALAPDNVWAAGSDLNGSVVVRWDGVAWTPLESPNLGRLTGITALSNLDVWVASEAGTMAHWNGSTWTRVPLPVSGWSPRVSAPVVAAGNLWFVAAYSNDQRNATHTMGLVIRYSRSCAEELSRRRAPLNPPIPVPGTNTRFFETGNRVNGVFLDYWDAHGGLPQQGLPLTELVGEVSPLNNVMYTVQYFERAVFEYHPENRPPYNVLLSQLGAFQLKRRYPGGAPGQTPNNDPGSLFFPETGKRLGGRFLNYWRDHGGLMQQGYPITDEFTEISELNGQPYTVQYFERAVFEYHPENAGTEHEVQLSHLARFRYYQLYANVPTPAPLHSPTPPATSTAPITGTATPTPSPGEAAKYAGPGYVHPAKYVHAQAISTR